MKEQSGTNKVAWNYRAYEFWLKYNGSPAKYAKQLLDDIHGNINERYVDLLSDVKNKRILNVLGSNGRKAAPLSLLGADVTVIDISEENQRYALELAEAAGVSIRYEIGDFITYRNEELLETFDIVFCEGGILHYFSDLLPFFSTVNGYLKDGGTLILNDFHPFRKVLFPEIGTDGDYFDVALHEGHVAYEDRFPESEWQAFPKCLLRCYRMGEIITGLGKNGLFIEEMRELPRMGMEKIPAEFTIVARKMRRSGN